MTMIRQTAFAAGFLALASCGPLAQDGLTTQLVGAVQQAVGGAEAVPPPPQLATDEDIDNNPGQFIRVNFRDLGTWDTMVAAASNAGRDTWIGAANLSVTFEDGIVVATRGMPRDLMGADTDQVRAAIDAGGGAAQRTHDFLDNLDQISTRVLQCGISSQGADSFVRREQTHDTTRFEEKCASEQLQFTNVYWVNAEGQIVRSLQAVSPDAGYLQIDVF